MFTALVPVLPHALPAPPERLRCHELRAGSLVTHVREVQEAFLEEVRPASSGQRKGRKRPSVTEPTREQETLPFTEPAMTVACFSAPGVPADV